MAPDGAWTLERLPSPARKTRRRSSVLASRPDGSPEQSPAHGRKGGGKGGGGSPRTPVEAPNTLRSKSVGRVIDLVSEGEISGLVEDGLKSVYLDGTRVENDDGTLNFEGVEITERFGTADQTYLPGFPSVETEIGVATEVLKATPITRTVTDALTDALLIKIRTPSLNQRNESNGDLNPSSFSFAIHVANDGEDFVLKKSATISGKTTSPYERNYRIELDAGGAPWTVKVERTSADSTKTIIQNTMIWSAYTRLIDSKLSYPHSALYGARVDARLFGERLPARAFLIDGIKLRQPSNYDAINRTYDGIWDGTFTVQASGPDGANPAWVLYDLMVEDRYGLGDLMDASQVDKWGLYTIAQYCDEMVDDGFGGTEPRFAINTVINTREEAYNVLNAIAGAFRGMIYWGAGLVSAVQDAPADSARLVTPANVIDGTFNYEGVGLKARHSVCLVTWNNPDDLYKPHVVAVEDKDSIARYGWRVKQETAYGCTSKGQATRFGRWILDSERNQTETVTYRCGYDQATLRPGEVIDIADPSIAGARMGGRMVSISSDLRTVTVDDWVTLDPAETYDLAIILPNETIESRTVSLTESYSDVLGGWPNLTSVATLRQGANLGAAGGLTKVLTVTEAFSEAPVDGAMWVLTASNLAPRQFRVVSVREAEKGVFEITALLHEPAKYVRVEQDLILETPDVTILPSGPIPAPTDPSTSEFLYRAGAAIRSAVTFSWLAPSDPRVIEYEIAVKRPNDADFETVGKTGAININILDTEKGVYQFRVRGLTGLGEVSQYLVHSESLLGLLAPPTDPTNFEINVIDGTAFLSWDQCQDLDFRHSILKFTPATSGVTWGSAVQLVPPIDGQSIAVPSMVGTYLIKHVDTSDVESKNAALILSTISEVAGLNAVTTVIEDPTFAGVKTDVVVASGRLQLGGSDVLSDWSDLTSIPSLSYGLGGIATSGTYEFFNSPDLGAVYTSRLTAIIDADGNNLFNFLSTWSTLAGVEFLSGTDPSQWSVNLQIRTTDDDPAGSPTWSDWQNFFIGDYSARAFEFRLQMFSTNPAVTPRVTQLRIEVDMPDRTEGAGDVVADAAGTTIAISPAFRAEPAYAIAGQNMATGDYFEITGKSASGFTVRFFNSGGVGISRTFDWIARGYGRAN